MSDLRRFVYSRMTVVVTAEFASTYRLVLGQRIWYETIPGNAVRMLQSEPPAVM